MRLWSCAQKFITKEHNRRSGLSFGTYILWKKKKKNLSDCRRHHGFVKQKRHRVLLIGICYTSTRIFFFPSLPERENISLESIREYHEVYESINASTNGSHKRWEKSSSRVFWYALFVSAVYKSYEGREENRKRALFHEFIHTHTWSFRNGGKTRNVLLHGDSRYIESNTYGLGKRNISVMCLGRNYRSKISSLVYTTSFGTRIKMTH